MRIETFDKVSKAILFSIFGFSFGVAVASWKWFPVKGDWARFAEIPQDPLNYVSLLAPLIFLY